jgi:hypothetical protein
LPWSIDVWKNFDIDSASCFAFVFNSWAEISSGPVALWGFCQLFVRLWYRVSDVLDLSLVSKRFGFWPHITHVIVLTFKEI